MDTHKKHIGSIPAHAGKPVSGLVPAPRAAVYPRPRGEAGPMESPILSTRGLSPPTRGSRDVGLGRRVEARSIPAHAGKPSPAAAGPAMPSVYPRPRGEAVASPHVISYSYGLSPPTRGSLADKRPTAHWRRSIPAHAGKPPGRWEAGGWSRVYPRPRGEASLDASAFSNESGLSPPTRGSLSSAPRARIATGSIPAHAGKPPR